MLDVEAIVGKLAEIYPHVSCSLEYAKPYELLFATRLSAQCTDVRVNLVTRGLFERFATLESFAEADVAELEEIVRPCGFYRHKARDLKLSALRLLEVYGGELPDTMEDLLTLSGVGRKTANLILGELFGKPTIVVDTHCIRLSNRLGFADTKEPEKVERRIAELVPPEERLPLCHRFVAHGREVCKAQRPACGNCGINGLCNYYTGKD
ncbi:endonuclease III [Clostridia bacterium]|nr:endonuclease III [Clostridia bacterium]